MQTEILLKQLDNTLRSPALMHKVFLSPRSLNPKQSSHTYTPQNFDDLKKRLKIYTDYCRKKGVIPLLDFDTFKEEQNLFLRSVLMLIIDGHSQTVLQEYFKSFIYNCLNKETFLELKAIYEFALYLMTLKHHTINPYFILKNSSYTFEQNNPDATLFEQKLHTLNSKLALETPQLLHPQELLESLTRYVKFLLWKKYEKLAEYILCEPHAPLREMLQNIVYLRKSMTQEEFFKQHESRLHDVDEHLKPLYTRELRALWSIYVILAERGGLVLDTVVKNYYPEFFKKELYEGII